MEPHSVTQLFSRTKKPGAHHSSPRRELAVSLFSERTSLHRLAKDARDCRSQLHPAIVVVYDQDNFTAWRQFIHYRSIESCAKFRGDGNMGLGCACCFDVVG